MRQAMIEATVEGMRAGRNRKVEKRIEFRVGLEQQEFFDAVRTALLTSCLSGGDNKKQYSLPRTHGKRAEAEYCSNLKRTPPDT